jgi:hypothetical protein
MANSLILAGGQRGRRLAGLGAVVEGAGGGEAKGADFDRPLGDGGHGGDVGLGRRLAVGAALAHHMHP